MKQKTEEIWFLFQERLKSFIISKIYDETIATDILQEVFVKIHSNIDSLKDESKIQSWIFQITRNAIIDYHRSKRKGEFQIDPFIEEPEVSESSEFMAETLQDMIKMIDDLPEKDCEALCLTELGNMSQIEYARKLGISYSGAKSRIQRAKRKLRDLLMNCCHYQFDKYGTVIDITPVSCCCCN